MADISHEYKHNRPQFMEKAKMWVKKHASGDLSEGVRGEAGSEVRGQSQKRGPPLGSDCEGGREAKQSRIQ